jgi:hypothetical protein
MLKPAFVMAALEATIQKNGSGLRILLDGRVKPGHDGVGKRKPWA